ncbi:Holliday junction branch migration protein RuvA [Candidatus Peregrinibacteria bacterium]|nr:Holliday junction branch migration protein RuvA [Candidatus Peregrinibacteria bacterium]
MISNLHGTVKKHIGGAVTVDVRAVGYRVMTPLNVWERLEDGAMVRLWISTYVREDRLALFGFLEENMRTLFEKLLERPGIGPRLALELCGCPAHFLAQAIAGDTEILQMVKGVGKKSAEKLVIELKSLASKHPELFVRPNGITEQCPSTGEDDAVAALKGLGYDHPTILTVLAALPKNLRTPEERITAALRSL